MEGLERLAAEAPEVRRFERVDRLEDMDAALARLLASGINLLVINGGDGTVQAVLTRLRRLGPAAEFPAIAILAGGNTNLIARDIGIPGAPEAAFKRLLAQLRGERQPPRLAYRSLIRVQRHPDEPPVYGGFLGAGAIVKAIQLSRQRLQPLGLGGQVESALALSMMVGRLTLRSLTRDPTVAPQRIGLGLGQRTAVDGDFTLFFVTGLERLFLGIRPFWGREPGRLRCTGLLHPHIRLIRNLPNLFRGRATQGLVPENGYLSHNVDHVSLTLDAPFVLDGELIEPHPDQPVAISHGGGVPFLTL